MQFPPAAGNADGEPLVAQVVADLTVDERPGKGTEVAGPGAAVTGVVAAGRLQQTDGGFLLQIVSGNRRSGGVVPGHAVGELQVFSYQGIRSGQGAAGGTRLSGTGGADNSWFCGGSVPAGSGAMGGHGDPLQRVSGRTAAAAAARSGRGLASAAAAARSRPGRRHPPGRHGRRWES